MSTQSVTDRWIRARGLNFHLRDWGGTGTPLVLLHGLASQSRIFDLVAPQLSHQFRVIALDQRGHGESGKPTSGYSLNNIAKDLHALMNACNFKRAVIVGHSWGGNVALQFAIQFPDRAAALVLVDGGFIDLQSDPKMTWTRTRKLLAPPKLAGMPVEKFSALLRREALNMRMPALEQVVMQNFEILPNETIRPHLSYANHLRVLRGMWEQRPTELFAQLQVPTLFIPARRKPHDSRERGFLDAKKRILDRVVEISAFHRMIWFDDTVHDVPLQRPRKLVNVIIQFSCELGLVGS